MAISVLFKKIGWRSNGLKEKMKTLMIKLLSKKRFAFIPKFKVPMNKESITSDDSDSQGEEESFAVSSSDEEDDEDSPPPCKKRRE